MGVKDPNHLKITEFTIKEINGIKIESPNTRSVILMEENQNTQPHIQNTGTIPVL